MQVSVIETPSFTNAATARRSRSTIQSACFSCLALVKSVPRGSVIVGMRTVRPSPFFAASDSSHLTPASPRLSVSAITCACVTATKSCAPKNSPTLIWCVSASFGTAPNCPASMAVSSSFSSTVAPPSSIRRRTRITDSLGPSRHFRLLELSQRQRFRRRLHPEVAEFLLECIGAYDPLDLVAQRTGDFGRHVGRPEYCPPCG